MSWKRWFLGTPLETERFQEERLRVPIALAVFSSDALSSVAYATEEILLVLSIAGMAALDYSMPISAVIALLLFVVIVSYRQTIHAYPEGGGSYIVARENLGTLWGLIAAAALLLDYILTVAVSTAAGVAAVTSAFPGLLHDRVAVGLLFLFLLAVGNLRGVRQSGRIFAVPTYMFIFSMAALIVTGIVRAALLGYPAVEPPVAAAPEIQHALNLWLLMKAFSAGCAALTGIEAVSNGVQAFRKPEARNASLTLMIMAVILAFFFLGTSYLAHVYTVIPGAQQTVVSQLGRAIFGKGLLYYLMQIATASILMVAANTAFADFPRLSSILARDRFVPRQLANLGDRLVYSNGILILAGSAGFLLILFGGNTHRLIPLYAVGVFLAFTLSQSGMVVRHVRLKGERYRLHAVINAAGATATGAALLVIATTKFVQGAWIVILLIPLFVIFFLRTHRHYFYVRQQLSLREIEPERPLRHTAIVPISAVNRATVYAVRYAKSIAHEVEAVHVAIDPARVDQVRKEWKAWGGGVPLRVLESPYRSMVQPLVDHIDDLMHGRRRNEMVTVVLPEFVTAHWWEGLFHNQSAFLIKGALLFRPGVVVTSIPFHFSR
jgi:amino acid transporter